MNISDFMLSFLPRSVGSPPLSVFPEILFFFLPLFSTERLADSLKVDLYEFLKYGPGHKMGHGPPLLALCVRVFRLAGVTGPE